MDSHPTFVLVADGDVARFPPKTCPNIPANPLMQDRALYRLLLVPGLHWKTFGYAL
jgi:hypothetical protein